MTESPDLLLTVLYLAFIAAALWCMVLFSVDQL